MENCVVYVLYVRSSTSVLQFRSRLKTELGYSRVHTSNLTELVSASLWHNIFVPWSWSLWI